MRPRWLMPAMVGLVMLLVVVGVVVHPVNGSGQGANAKPAPVVGHPAPSFSLADVNGKSVRLDQYRGKVVLINFFATWCIPCRQELPLINRTLLDHPAQLAVLAVDKQEPPSDVRQFADAEHLAFAPLLDPNLTVWRLYGVSNIQPVSFWIDRTGTIRAIDYSLDGSTVRRELQRLSA